MKLIPVDDLIKILLEKNIDLGKGDPYNRIRYYTKIGWIPHMIRKKNDNNVIAGHYPSEVIDKIIKIEKMKSDGLSNTEITKKIQEETSINNRELSNNFRELTSNFKELANLSFQYRYTTIEGIKLVVEKTTIWIKENVSFTKTLFLLILISLLVDIVFFRNNKEILTTNTQESQFSNEKTNFSSGETFIPKGQSKIFINEKGIRNSDTVIVSFEGNIFPATFYFISEIKENQGFYLETNIPVSNEVKLKWILMRK